jgi:hypothetical protein
MICFMKLGTPGSYADAFRRLQQVSMIDASLADRLVRAAGFRNCVAYAYETLDMTRVTAAPGGPGGSARLPGLAARPGGGGGSHGPNGG